ncbi:MAG: TauD/TfdA family dioxygenase [Gammaproteobacteria bacterium]
MRRLSAGDIAEIDAALERVLARGLNSESITKDEFLLPSLGAKLTDVSRELEDGCGLVKFNGLPVENYTDSELRTLCMAIGSHLGTLVYQNAYGQLLREICDEGSDVGTRYGQVKTTDIDVFLSSRARVSSSAALRFHTDRADVVGLLCIRSAKTGGISKVASSVAVHNEMLKRRPELLELLFRDIYRSRLGEEEGGEHMVYTLPVFGIRNGKFTSHYSRTYIEAAQLFPQVPNLSDAQWEALDVLAALAEELCFEMEIKPGDMQFLNNHVIYHARMPFEDMPEQRRLFYRIWLCVPNHRALPIGHEVLWGNIEAGQLRGGIRQAIARD